MKRTASAILASLLLTAMLASCASGGQPSSGVETTSTAAAVQTSETAAAETTKYTISPYLPEKTYGGAKLVILGLGGTNAIRKVIDIDTEEENGEPLNDAVFTRNRRVEEKLDIEINGLLTDNTVATDFSKSALSGDHMYDLVVDNLTSALTSTASGYTLSADKLGCVDITREWWDTEAVESLALNGKHYMLVGDITTNTNGATWCLLFNRDTYEANSLKLPYDMIFNGSWTLDKFIESIQGYTRELDGDGVLTYHDQWGYLASLNTSGAIFWACGGSFSQYSPDGTIKLKLTDERNLTIMQRLGDALNSGDAILLAETVTGFDTTKYANSARVIEGAFAEGRALFYGGCIYSLPIMRNLMQDADFGVLPLPKFDEKQDDYISTAQEWIGCGYTASVTTPDPERSGVLLEAMSSASVTTLTPAYYDITLGVKGVRDEESVKSLDILLGSKIYDIAYAANWGGLRSVFTKALQNNTAASSMAASQIKIEAAMKESLDKLK